MKIHADIHEENSPLSPKENQVFGLMAEGLSRPEMSDRLHRSLSTINTHFNHIFQKLDADSRTNAVVIGVIKGILSFKNFMLCWLVVSSIFGLINPSTAYASENESGDAEIDPPTERVRGGRGGLKVNRVFGRKGSSRRREDTGLELWLDEE